MYINNKYIFKINCHVFCSSNVLLNNNISIKAKLKYKNEILFFYYYRYYYREKKVFYILCYILMLVNIFNMLVKIFNIFNIKIYKNL